MLLLIPVALDNMCDLMSPLRYTGIVVVPPAFVESHHFLGRRL